MIEGGYILQPRTFDSSESSHMSPVSRELLFYLLRNVNHSGNGKLRRGQGYFSLPKVQSDLAWYVGYRLEKYSISSNPDSLSLICHSLISSFDGLAITSALLMASR